MSHNILQRHVTYASRSTILSTDMKGAAPGIRSLQSTLLFLSCSYEYKWKTE